MQPKQVVRFTSNSRHGDWKKGEFGMIERVLAMRPANLSDVYVVQIGTVRPFTKRVWATHEDIERFDQLTIWSELTSRR